MTGLQRENMKKPDANGKANKVCLSQSVVKDLLLKHTELARDARAGFSPVALLRAVKTPFYCYWHSC